MTGKSQALYASLFDASALVKVYVEEFDSSQVRDFFYRASTKYTTPFCFYETLLAFKTKWRKGTLDQLAYHDAAFRLTAWFEASSRHVSDLNLHDLSTFFRVRAIAEKHKLDLSDAFQLVSITDGWFKHLANDSRTLLVTADGGLALAARNEGLRVWDVLNEPPPAPVFV